MQISVDGAISCDDECQGALSLLFADSVATWKMGCQRCERDALVMLKTPSKAWLDRRLARRLRMISAGRTVSLDPEDYVEGDGGDSFSPLADLAAEPEVASQLCAVRPDAARWVQSVQFVLCEPMAQPPRGILQPKVRLLAGPTTCGKEAVACGLPEAGIEISFANYRFALPHVTGGGEMIAGTTGDVLDLRAVVLHEVGHWFGVPHAEVGATDGYLDIMADAYGAGSQCVSPHSLRLTANAGDTRWPFRVVRGGALSGPRQSNASR